jgi:hypothetical protein
MNTTPNPARARRWRRRAVVVPAIVGALALTGCLDESANPPMHDVDAGWECIPDAGGGVRSVGTVTNHSSKTSFYVIDLAVEVGGDTWARGSASVDGVEPGETVRIDTLIDDDDDEIDLTDAECTVTSVDRFKA